MAYTLYLSLTTGINEALARKWDLKVYPNPSNAKLVIEGGWKYDDQIKYKFFDVTGKWIKSGLILGKKKRINVANLSAGIYVLSLDIEGELVNKKIVIE